MAKQIRNLASGSPRRGDALCVAVVVGAHGVRGLVKLKSYTEDSRAVAAFGPLRDRNGKRFEVTIKGMVRGMVLAQLSGVFDRDQAQEMRGTELYVDRGLLPAIENEDEFYYSELVGLTVESPEGETLGKVTGVFNFGAGDILEFDREEFDRRQKSQMVSFTETTVPLVDLVQGKIVVSMPQEVSARASEGQPGGRTARRAILSSSGSG